jgi:hypothetical protein
VRRCAKALLRQVAPLSWRFWGHGNFSEHPRVSGTMTKPTKQLTPAHWGWLLLLLVIFGATPLRMLWPLLLIVLGFLVILQRLNGSTALLMAAVGFAASIFGTLGWRNTNTEACNLPELNWRGLETLEVLLNNSQAQLYSGNEQQIAIRCLPNGRIEASRQGNNMLLVLVNAKATLNASFEGTNITFSGNNNNLTLGGQVRSLKIDNTNGGVRLKRFLASSSRVETSNAAIEVVESNLKLIARNANAAIIVQNSPNGQFDLATTNDSIEVDGSSGSFEIKNSNGDIRLRQMLASTVNIETNNGEIELSNVVLRAGSINTINHHNDTLVLYRLSAPDGLDVFEGGGNERLNISASKISPGNGQKNSASNTLVAQPGAHPAQLRLQGEGEVRLTD